MFIYLYYEHDLLFLIFFFDDPTIYILISNDFSDVHKKLEIFKFFLYDFII